MPHSFYYSRSALGNAGLLDEHKVAINKLLTGDYTQKNVKKLAGHNIYSLRTGNQNAGRLLFTTKHVLGENHLLILEYLPTHGYANSHFLRPGVLRHYLERQTNIHVGLAAGAAAAEEALTFTMPSHEEMSNLPMIKGEPKDEALKGIALDYYKGDMIELSTTQKKALHLTLPAVISGVSGSGKSCIALLLLAEVRKPRVLYVTENPALVDEIQKAWADLPILQDENRTIDILTYEALLAQNTTGEIIAKDRAGFNQWHAKYTAGQITRSKLAGQDEQPYIALSADVMHQEFRICSGFTKDEYLTLGKRQSLIPKTEREALYKAYETYLCQFTATEVNAEFCSITPKEENRYDFVVTDEAQDFSFAALNNLHAFARDGTIAYCMDSHQSLYDELSARPYLLSRFQASHTLLEKTYRCPVNVVLAANLVIALKSHVTGGLADKQESHRIEAVSESKESGAVYLLNKESLTNSDWLAAEKVADFVVIADEKHHAEARAYFKTDLVLTPEEIKGLEFKTVVAYRLFDGEVFKTANKLLSEADHQIAAATHRAKAGVGDSRFGPAFNRVYTSYTRAQETLIILEDFAHYTKNLLKALSHVCESGLPALPGLSEESTKDDWLTLVNKLLKSNNTTLAKSIFEAHISSEQDSFDDFVKNLHAPLDVRPIVETVACAVPEVSGHSDGDGFVPDEIPACSEHGGVEEPVPTNVCMSHAEERSPKNKNRTKSKSSPKSTTDSAPKSITEYAHMLHKTLSKENLREALKYHDLEKLLILKLDDGRKAKKTKKGCKNLIAFIKDDERRVRLLCECLAEKEIIQSINIQSIISIAKLSLTQPKKTTKALYLNSMLLQLKEKVLMAQRSPLGFYIQTEDFNEVDRLLSMINVDINQATWAGETPAFIAAQKGLPELLKVLKKKGANLNKAKPDGTTPLYAAAHNDHVEMVKLLSELGADINQARKGGETPLYAAACHGHIEVVKVLSELGADVNQALKGGATPAFAAAQNGHIAVLKALKKKGADVNQAMHDSTTPVYAAAHNGHIEMIRVLSELGADLNKPMKGGATPAFTAIDQGHIDLLRVLSELGADLNQVMDNGATLACIAADRGLVDLLRVLNELGADLNQAMKSSITPVFIAAQNGHVDVVRALHELGAEVNQARDDGATPIFIAAENGHVEVVRALHELGAEVNQARDDGATPVLIAAQNNHIAMLKVLSQLGAELNQARNDTITPAFIAARNGHVKLVSILSELGTDLNQVTEDGATPLYAAAESGHAEMVRLLSVLGSDVNQPMDNAATPAFIAAQNGHIAVLKVLSQLGADLNQARNDTVTPAFIAAQNGHAAALKALSQLGANVNQAIEFGATPLYVAAHNGHVEMVRVLSALGADVNQPMDNGSTPAFTAAQNGHLAVLKVLSQLGADLNKPMSGGATPLYAAAQNGFVEIIQVLIALGAHVNQPVKGGATAAFSAVSKDHLDVLRVLSELGADLNQALDNGITLACIAADESDVNLLRELSALGADLNKPMSDGETPACIAARNGHTEVIKVLSELGADLNKPMSDGATPTCIAAEKGFTEVVKVLSELGADLNKPMSDGAASTTIGFFAQEENVIPDEVTVKTKKNQSH